MNIGGDKTKLIDALTDAVFKVASLYGTRPVWDVLVYSPIKPIEAIRHQFDQTDSGPAWSYFEHTAICLQVETSPQFVLRTIRQAIETYEVYGLDRLSEIEP